MWWCTVLYTVDRVACGQSQDSQDQLLIIGKTKAGRLILVFLCDDVLFLSVSA